MFESLKRGFSNGRKGQMTAFIIISILVVAGVVLFFLLSPDARSSIGLGGEQTPQQFIQSCLGEPLEEMAREASSQGGSLEPEPSYMFNGTQVQYLCYAEEPYTRCNVNVPFVRSHLENELEQGISSDVDSCFDSLEDNYPDSSLDRGDYNVRILPERVVTRMNYTFTYTEEEQTQTVEEFEIVLNNNNLYLLTSIAQSILEWETTYGQADTTTYMNLYRDVRVRKFRQTDGTIVYGLRHENTGDRFQLASRSLYFPPGFS